MYPFLMITLIRKGRSLGNHGKGFYIYQVAGLRSDREIVEGRRAEAMSRSLSASAF